MSASKCPASHAFPPPKKCPISDEVSMSDEVRVLDPLALLSLIHIQVESCNGSGPSSETVDPRNMV